MGCRKNLTRLTITERQAFTNAVNQLRADGNYTPFVDQHQGALGHGHGGPAFFPWHREFVLRFEHALQAIDSSVSLPYWDWTAENLNSAGTESLIWRNDFMGGPRAAGTGNVTTCAVIASISLHHPEQAARLPLIWPVPTTRHSDRSKDRMAPRMYGLAVMWETPRSPRVTLYSG